MTGGAITALTCRKLKQMTIKQSLSVGKTRCIARFLCDSMAFLLAYYTLILVVRLITWLPNRPCHLLTDLLLSVSVLIG